MALGLMVGICVKAVQAVQQDRQANFVIKTGAARL